MCLMCSNLHSRVISRFLKAVSWLVRIALGRLGAPNRQMISRYNMSAVSSAVVEFTGNANSCSHIVTLVNRVLVVTKRPGNVRFRRVVVSFLPRTALHGMQTRSSDENSVCPSVRPSVRLSVCHTRGLWQNGRKICPYERTFILVFWEEEWLVGGDPFYVKFWVNRPQLERNRRFSTNNARSSSTVTPSEKSSINANRKSTTRFPLSPRWSSYVALSPPKFSEKKNGWWGATPFTWNFGSTDPSRAKSPIFNQ